MRTRGEIFLSIKKHLSIPALRKFTSQSFHKIDLNSVENVTEYMIRVPFSTEVFHPFNHNFHS